MTSPWLTVWQLVEYLHASRDKIYKLCQRGKIPAYKRDKAPGVDGVVAEEYGKNLEANLKGLVERMKAKSYRPQPV